MFFPRGLTAMTDFNQEITPESDNSWGTFFTTLTSIPSIIRENLNAKSEAIDKQNHDALFYHLNNQNWAEIKGSIQFGHINKFAHLHNNKLYFEALEANQIDLCQYLFTLNNVTDEFKKIDSELLLTTLAYAVYTKKWGFAEQLLNNPYILKTLNEQFRCSLTFEIKYPNDLDACKNLSHMFITIQPFQDCIQSLFIEEFGEEIAEEEFKLLLSAAFKAAEVAQPILIEEKNLDEEIDLIEKLEQSIVAEENAPLRTKLQKKFIEISADIILTVSRFPEHFAEPLPNMGIPLQHKIVDIEPESESADEAQENAGIFTGLFTQFKNFTKRVSCNSTVTEEFELNKNLKRKSDKDGHDNHHDTHAQERDIKRKKF